MTAVSLWFWKEMVVAFRGRFVLIGVASGFRYEKVMLRLLLAAFIGRAVATVLVVEMPSPLLLPERWMVEAFRMLLVPMTEAAR